VEKACNVPGNGKIAGPERGKFMRFIVRGQSKEKYAK
jgi:hypothetical protein